MNNRQKMYESNSSARYFLTSMYYQNIHFFQHTRFLKDFNLDSEGFDGIASKEKYLVLIQIKTNKSCPKKTKENYLRLSKKYNCHCMWINVKPKKEIQVFTTESGGDV